MFLNWDVNYLKFSFDSVMHALLPYIFISLIPAQKRQETIFINMNNNNFRFLKIFITLITFIIIVFIKNNYKNVESLYTSIINFYLINNYINKLFVNKLFKL
jgi:hypothetical protein